MDVGGWQHPAWSSFDGVDFNKSSCPSTVLKSKVFINLLIKKDRIKLLRKSNFSCQYCCTTSQLMCARLQGAFHSYFGATAPPI